jgi:transposase InsO family protein
MPAEKLSRSMSLAGNCYGDGVMENLWMNL